MPHHPYNVIILHADEMRGDCAGFAGNREIRTPHLDTFANRSVTMSNHFTVHGKCLPSRVAMMTGRYCHTDGIRTIPSNCLPAQAPCLMKTLRASGYETAVFGHDHCWDGFWGRDNEKSTGATDYHSFTRGEFAELLKTSRACPAPGAGARASNTLPEGYLYGGRVSGELTGFCDDNRAEQAIHFMRRARDRSRPFFMQLNLSMPHPKYQIEEPWFSLHDPARLTLFPHQLPNNAPLPLRAQRRIRTGDHFDESSYREVLACYYGMISKVDHLMGQVLAAIKEEKLFENSIVIFTSDHGDFAGQYGLWEKYDTVLADCLMRVPFLISAPALPRGTRIDSMTEHVDLAPTILDILQMEVPPQWTPHGESMLPAISNQRRKTAVFADGGHEAAMRSRINSRRSASASADKAYSGKQRTYIECPDSMARATMIRTERWKLVVRETGGDELYDLAADPWELDNRFADASLLAVRAELMELLLRWRLRTDADRPFIDDVIA